ncbi:3-keto-disaccharide hydrolase [Aporhodopirellula aestuarii]|uniref:DUF1080 domain-containing protein n=1 Tax=Aporhodopirellula aestuarii TaxID=2950107 RepID=A0ABT0UAX3_9BACT|nr:DUF1080 domain-containing protein [Aporhodopirellula aestuarii]MCM2373538.1 DUF1080 domain-containing protein [Aporhodopirellula aestuarii]
MYSRRQSLKLLGVLSGSLVTPTFADDAAGSAGREAESLAANPHQSAWERDHDRIWLGAEYWANPMEDWAIVDGAAELVSAGGYRNVHLITHHLTNPSGAFRMSTRVSEVEHGDGDGSVGFLIGVRSELDEVKSNCFAANVGPGKRKNKKGPVTAGVRQGEMFIGDDSVKLNQTIDLDDVTVGVGGKPDGQSFELTLTVRNAAGESVGEMASMVSPEAVRGNIAIGCNLQSHSGARKGLSRFRFHDWQVSGDAFTVDADATWGPILWTMYSLSDSRGDDGFVLKLTALTPPLGENDSDEVRLQIRRGEQWETIGNASLDHDAWTATFRIANWDASSDVPFRVVYAQSYREGETSEHEWAGTIKANPQDRPLKFAALTCQHDSGFPYAPVSENLLRLDPDLLYFSGDQLYEGNGGFGIIREPADKAIVNYLRKFYMFGWAFGEPMRYSPTLCIPDDHDVFQGNIWGEGGVPMNIADGKDGGASSKGGYREPVRMVNAVHRTCVAHHPDAYDPTPAAQGMSVYYGDMVYGGVSFAIVADRQFKSGPEKVETGSGRADHVVEKDFDTSVLDKPGLELLGERQEAFLKHWADDWRGANMKVLLSQTVFAGVATHHGSYNGYLKADLDSGGWPQTARNRTVDIIRKSKALHVSGDQHLTTLSQYGVDDQRDSNWSFCTPAISAGYPRWWRPDEENMPHANRPMHDLPNTGEYVDGFGNLVYIYAVGNPVVAKSANRYERAHEKGSGFGYVLLDPNTQTYEIHSYRFLVDVTDGKPENEFPGWPVTLHVEDNSGARRLFNGVNMDGWHGQPHFDPYKLDEMPAEEKTAKFREWTADAAKHWRVEDGELINDGAGPYLTTNEEFEDYELELEYKTVAKADSGIYLKGTPQVQIWDSTQESKFAIGANLGSGGLWNNSKGSPGKDPLVLADRPFGEWNKVRVIQVGARTSVWLNEQLVVDRAIMENFWRRDEPLRRRGPIQLQTHGGEIRWKNITLRPLSTAAANAYLAEDDDTGFVSLTDGKTLDGWIGAVDDYEVTPEGTIQCRPGRGGNLLTKDEYDDFIVRLYFRLPPRGNNGLAIRCPLKGDAAYVAMCELQVLDNDHPAYAGLDPRQYHGSAYGMAAAARGYLRPIGEWNYQQVRVEGSTIEVELNGNVILKTDLSKITDFKSDSPHPGKDRKSGHFGFAGHNDPVEYRDVTIRRLK